MERRYFVPRKRMPRNDSYPVDWVSLHNGSKIELPKPKDFIRQGNFLNIGSRFLLKFGFSVPGERVSSFYKYNSFSELKIYHYLGGGPNVFYIEQRNFSELIQVLEGNPQLIRDILQPTTLV